MISTNKATYKIKTFTINYIVFIKRKERENYIVFIIIEAPSNGLVPNIISLGLA